MAAIKNMKWTDVFILNNKVTICSSIHFFELTSDIKCDKMVIFYAGSVKFNLYFMYICERLVLKLLSVYCKKGQQFFPVPSQDVTNQTFPSLLLLWFQMWTYACLSKITYSTFLQSFHKPEIQQLCPFKTLSELCWVRVHTDRRKRSHDMFQ